MAFPNGFLDDLRARLTLSDIVGRKVLWDQRKSNPAKGDFWAPCPFHQEKTASFHVDDRKGFYYCFGCHEKGDMISFVKSTENMSFVEAVEVLAGQAGVEMPKQSRDPRAAEKRDRAQRLGDVMEQAVNAFGLAFRSAGGAAVRRYVEERGLSPDTLKRFEIGYAPDSRTHLTQAFREKGLLEEAIGAGLVIKADDGSVYDRFRGRLMFPIRDPRGRCIAFGGRAMDPNARAKYLNSPETELFHKSRVLYNHGPAREAAGKVGGLIVAEGYMDVIALAQAGFDHAVAPLGTAITDEQLSHFWRIADEPVIALDGDKAGMRAAERLIDLAMPLLQPGKSLRFCLMPEGQDPDDLIKAGGPDAMKSALDQAVPLIEMLWRRETGREELDTPERWAAFKKRLRDATRQIGDSDVRNAYGERLAEKLAEMQNARRAPRQQAPARQGKRRGGFRGPQIDAGPLPTTRASQLSHTGSRQTEARVREAGILAGVLLHPSVLPDIEDALDNIRIVNADLASLRDALMAVTDAPDVATTLVSRLGYDPLPGLTSVGHLRMHPLARRNLDRDHVIDVIKDAIARHEAILTAEAELSDAGRDLAGAEDESWTRRIEQVAAERRHVDAFATNQDETSDDAPTSSIFQRMIDENMWRRRGTAKRS